MPRTFTSCLWILERVRAIDHEVEDPFEGATPVATRFVMPSPDQFEIRIIQKLKEDFQLRGEIWTDMLGVPNFMAWFDGEWQYMQRFYANSLGSGKTSTVWSCQIQTEWEDTCLHLAHHCIEATRFHIHISTCFFFQCCCCLGASSCAHIFCGKLLEFWGFVNLKRHCLP